MATVAKEIRKKEIRRVEAVGGVDIRNDRV
jgi:hypothetical protein